MSIEKQNGNLFAEIPDNFSKEIFNTIFKDDRLKIERIVSLGNYTPQGQWLAQDRDEWVLITQGSAKLLFELDNKIMCLEQGDYILIPAFCKHRVQWTDPKQKTVWLAVHGNSKKNS